MNIYRYKKYNFEKNRLPVGLPWKEPQVFAMSAPDDDYEIFNDQEYMDNFVAEKYVINEEAGRKYKNLISAKISNMVTSGIITLEDANSYADSTEKTRHYLSEGYWHSAYFSHMEHTPSDTFLGNLHIEVSKYIRNYVNTKYPSNFHV